VTTAWLGTASLPANWDLKHFLAFHYSGYFVTVSFSENARADAH
jgi:hypothetical protein